MSHGNVEHVNHSMEQHEKYGMLVGKESTNTICFNRCSHGTLTEGIYLVPSGYEAGVLSMVHDCCD